MANNVLASIPNHFTTQFDANWKHLVQQKNSRLRDYVTIDSIQGKEKSYNTIDTATMTEITDRSVNTRIDSQTMAKRWVRTREYDTTKLIDEWDEAKLGEVVLPTSPIVQSHGAAYARTCDSIIIGALRGNAATGTVGDVNTPLPEGQKIGVTFGSGTANSGLTLPKLRRAKFILDSNDVDEEEERIIVVSARQLQDLLGTLEVTSADYNTVRALVDGNINTFMGFKFRRTQLLPVTANVRSCYVYVKSGVVLAERGLKTYMDIRTDLSHSLQIRSVASLGAVRMEEKKVVEISCDEA